MDLVASIRKEGSRGGRSEFKWEDVRNDSQRENYLGHSLMAPVGRWQQGKDLSWYAKSDASKADADANAAANERAEEIRRIKEAEQDALAAALGFAPAPRRLDSGADMPASKADIEKAVMEATADDDFSPAGDTRGGGGGGRNDVDIDNAEGGGRGVGYGGYSGRQIGPAGNSDMLGGEGIVGDGMMGGSGRIRRDHRDRGRDGEDYTRRREDRHHHRRRKDDRRERERTNRDYGYGRDDERRRRDHRERSREHKHAHRSHHHHQKSRGHRSRDGRGRSESVASRGSRNRSQSPYSRERRDQHQHQHYSRRQRSPESRDASFPVDRRHLEKPAFRDRDDPDRPYRGRRESFDDRRGSYRASDRRRYGDDRYGGGDDRPRR